MIASNGRLVKLGDRNAYPRWYGKFPRVLGRYARDLGVLSLSEAIHKMTLIPVKAIVLYDRGIIEIEKKADLTLFNPKTITVNATLENPINIWKI